MLRVPELEEPPPREAEGADRGRVERNRSDVPAEQLAEPGLACPCARGRPAPRLRLGNVPADPEHQEGRRHADQEDPPLGGRVGEVGEEGHDARREDDAEVDAGLEHRGQPGAPAGRPRLREEAGPDGPFPADAEGSQKPEYHELPPRVRRGAEARAEGVGQDRERERLAPADAVAEPAKKSAAERPADQERRLDIGGLLLYPGIRAARGAQQVDDEGRGDQRVQVDLQPVEEPAEPCRDPGLPLPRGDAAKAFGFGGHSLFPGVTSSGRPRRPGPPPGGRQGRGTGCRRRMTGRCGGRTGRSPGRRRARRRCRA